MRTEPLLEGWYLLEDDLKGHYYIRIPGCRGLVTLCEKHCITPALAPAILIGSLLRLTTGNCKNCLKKLQQQNG